MTRKRGNRVLGPSLETRARRITRADGTVHEYEDRYYVVVVIVDGARSRKTYRWEDDDPEGKRAHRVARRYATMMEAQITCGDLDAPVTWAEAVDGYVEHRIAEGTKPESMVTARHNLEAVGRTLDDPDPLVLKRSDADLHVRLRLEAGIARATVRGEINAVTAMQRWMVRRGWLARATWADAHRPKGDPPKLHLLPHHVGAFMRAAERLAVEPPEGSPIDGWELWPAAAVLLMHGLRTGELVALDVDHLDLVHGVVYIADGKTQAAARPVPIRTKRGLAILRAAFGGLPAGTPCFVDTRSKKPKRLARRTKWFIKRVKITCVEAGIPVATSHELRHTFVSNALAVRGAHGETIDGRAASLLAGHADPMTTERRYSHRHVARVEPAAEIYGDALDRLWEGTATLEAVGS